jgi:hypothetical protein
MPGILPGPDFSQQFSWIFRKVRSDRRQVSLAGGVFCTRLINGPVYVFEEYVSGIWLTGFVKNKGISSYFNRHLIELLSKVSEAPHHADQNDIYHLCINP